MEHEHVFWSPQWVQNVYEVTFELMYYNYFVKGRYFRLAAMLYSNKQEDQIGCKGCFLYLIKKKGANSLSWAENLENLGSFHYSIQVSR